MDHDTLQMHHITHTHGCTQTDEHNAKSECQYPHQLDSEARQRMFNGNRRLSVARGPSGRMWTGTCMHSATHTCAISNSHHYW